MTIQLTVPEDLLKADAHNALINALREYSPAIALEIIVGVRERTPMLLGALRESETAKPYTSPVSGHSNINLVDWYTDDAPQLQDWGRVYAQYQEGPSLGISTYTNDPHQMFGRIETDDIGLIESWATGVIEDAANRFGLGGQGETTTFE